MFHNYLQVALRNLVANRLYSFINIIGLAVGLAACVMIALFVRDELSYDKHWDKADRIYRLHATFNIPGREPMHFVKSPGPAKHALVRYFSEDVAATTRIRTFFPTLSYKDQVASERIHWTDPETADIFNFDVIAGSMKDALDDKSSIAVDRSFAERYFGTTDALGEVVNLKIYDIARDYKVAAVFEDLPENTVLDVQAFAAIDEADFANQQWEFEQWYSTNSYMFFELKSGSNIDSINDRSADFVNNEIKIDPNAGAFDQASDFLEVRAQNIKDIQLFPQGRTGSEMKPTGSMTSVITFVAIAALTLLIACINFMNLATAKSTQRAREVALRKVLGAHRSQLMTQFIGESVLIALIGLAVGVALVELLIDPFGGFIGKSLMLDYSDGTTITLLVGLVIFVGAAGGAYPALVLSGFLPARVLKANKSAETSGSVSLRNILVITQFAISIGLIVATCVVYGQRLYVTSIDPGFSKERIMVVSNLNLTGMQGKQDALREQVEKIPGVLRTSLAPDTPVNGNTGNNTLIREGASNKESMLIGRQVVDHDFFELYDVELLAGRFYEKSRETDGMPSVENAIDGEQLEGTLILNGAASYRMGFASPAEAIGQRVRMGLDGEHEALLEIIGVVRDMQYQSMREPMRPEMYQLLTDYYLDLSIKFEGNVQPILQEVEAVWRGLAPEVPFLYGFIDDRIEEEFAREEQQSILLAVFALLAIVIACLGLYGLASFTAERRTKEIGIRKVMGASVFDIVRLLIWQFSKPVLLANLIAWPLVAYGMVSWLESFPYRLDSWIIVPLCIVAGLIALMIAWATVGGNAARVARANPIKALRYE